MDPTKSLIVISGHIIGLKPKEYPRIAIRKLNM
jgi:hypothetical protein